MNISLPMPDRIRSGFIDTPVILGENGGYNLEPSHTYPTDIPDSPIVQDIGLPFSLDKFGVTRTPFSIGQGSLEEVPVGMQINSLPIKFPGTEYRIPNELGCVRDILLRCISYEDGIVPPEIIESYYAYVSLQRTLTKPGVTQRSSTIHCDGIQGPRIQPKLAVEHGYVMVDRDPTEFFPDPVDMSGINVDIHDMGAVFAERVNRTRKLSFPVGELVMIDGYCVHEAVPASENTPRGFFRLLYGPRPYDRVGNSINALFQDDYLTEGWTFQPRPVPANLLPPPTP